MEYLYFACDWTVNFDEVKQLRKLIDIAAELDCHLRFYKMRTREGFVICRFVAQTVSRQVIDDLINAIGKDTNFTQWFPSSAEYYQEISYRLGEHVPDLQELLLRNVSLYNLGKMTEIWGAEGIMNQRLREMLDTDTVLYKTCDYIILSSSKDWLIKLIESTSVLGFGRDVRIGTPTKTDQGLIIHRFIIRVFSEAEYETFLERRPPEGFQGCSDATENDYFSAYSILFDKIDTWLQVFDRIAIANKSLSN